MFNIRNFCIIAHIDHGKSTLADRMLEITGTVDARHMSAQHLDTMDIEQERGITIKLQPVTMDYTCNGEKYTLNLIDTPGHVDFSYEVSRSLAAVEGAVLLVDASQGIQAQTLANLYLALEQDLVIIPVINKIDLPAADVPKTVKEIVSLLGCDESEIIQASGKTGFGVGNILDAVVARVPAPIKTLDVVAPRALIFDSNYDEYKGVVAHIRIVDGEIKKGDKIYFLATETKSEAMDVGIFKPKYFPKNVLSAGDIGYVVTGFKEVGECKVGDTITNYKLSISNGGVKPLPGYQEVKPFVFAGVFPGEGYDYEELREAIAKLKLNDASLFYEPERSGALGLGFRCGFLGLLHLEIFQERLRREYDLELIITIPSVAYRVYKNNGTNFVIHTPQEMPDAGVIEKIEEPWVNLDIICPKEYIGGVMNLAQEKKGIYKTTEYIDENRAILHYEIPMATILTDFYDKIKSISAGFASINYEYLDYRLADVVKMDIIVADEPAEALSMIIYRDDAFAQGKKIVNTLRDNLPKQMFVIKIQAAIGGKIIAAERISAMRKDVTAGLYGGDVSRKRKVLEKQKKGKKKMMASGVGKVDIPSDVFVKVLKQ
ncbi:elongation factor 4 [Patescibacteria group bacterium]|nr:elongation factor 4 [Patescibacteria group bacterium]